MKPEVLLDRVSGDPHLGGKALRLGRLVDALPGLVVLPTVVAASHAVAFDDADRQQHASMCTTARDDDGRRRRRRGRA